MSVLSSYFFQATLHMIESNLYTYMYMYMCTYTEQKYKRPM